jgi:hypothetical protein
VIGQIGVITTLEQLQGAEEVWRVSRRALQKIGEGLGKCGEEGEAWRWDGSHAGCLGEATKPPITAVADRLQPFTRHVCPVERDAGNFVL